MYYNGSISDRPALSCVWWIYNSL